MVASANRACRPLDTTFSSSPCPFPATQPIRICAFKTGDKKEVRLVGWFVGWLEA